MAAESKMLTLYGDAMSRAFRVVWMLKELGLEFEHVQTSFLDGSTHKPEFLAINPNGRVPVLKDGSFCIWESLCINIHLAKKYPSLLTPATLEEDTQVTMWTLWVVTEVEKTLLLAAANLWLFPEPTRSVEEAQMALIKLKRPFNVLESHLQGRAYLIGGRFTVADLNVASVMTLIPLAGIDITEYPAMSRWLFSCLERTAAADWKPIKFSIPRPPTSLGLLKMFV